MVVERGTLWMLLGFKAVVRERGDGFLDVPGDDVCDSDRGSACCVLSTSDFVILKGGTEIYTRAVMADSNDQLGGE